MITKRPFLAFFALSAMAISGCIRPEEAGNLNLLLTDSPIFDDRVEAIYVTVSEIYVDEKPFSGWSGKRSVDLLSLQNGNLFDLGIGAVEAKQHSHIRLVLDNLSDEQGNAPGCYVLTSDQQKIALSSKAQTELVTNDLFEVVADGEVSTVIDFDVQRAIVRGDNDTYRWAADEALRNATRAFERNKVAKISGKCEISSDLQPYKLVVYGYMTSTFNADFETQPDEYGILFRNALVSAEVDSTGKFNLGYLPEANLDIRVAYYENNNGVWELVGLLNGDFRNNHGIVVTTTAFPVVPFQTYYINIDNLRP